MDQMIQNWANRYYYTGMGLPAPATLPANGKYEEGFELNLKRPIAKLLGKETVENSEISSFLQIYQKLGVKSPFYMLAYFADNYNGGDWQSEVQSMLMRLEVVAGVVKDGKVMYIYRKDGKVVGTFPRTPHYICSTSMATQGEDIINTLLFKDGVTLTNEEINALKRLSRISVEYGSKIKDVTIEHYDGDRIVNAPINPLHPNFPPYEVRQLFKSLPEANAFPTKHEQAYQYASYASDIDVKVKEYLSRVGKLNTAAPEPEVKAEAMKEIQVTQEFAEKMQDALIGLPESNEVFNDVGEMLAHLVRTDYIGMGWSVCDAIRYYSLPDNDPYVPVDRYDFYEKKLTPANKKVLRQALQDVIKYVDNPQRPMTIEYLIEQLGNKETQIESQNTWDILHTCMVLLNVNNNRDVASLKGKEKNFDQQLQRQAVNFIKQGYDEQLTLKDAARGLIEPTMVNFSIEQLASMATALGCDTDVTLGDMQNGLSKHLDKTPEVHVSSLEDLLSSDILSQPEKERLQKLLTPINTMEDLQKSEIVDASVKSEVASNAKSTTMLTDMSKSLEGTELIKTELEKALEEAMQNYKKLLQAIPVESDSEPCRNIVEAFKRLEELKYTNNTIITSDDFAKETAITLLSDIRAGIKEAEKLPMLEMIQTKSAYIPVYYAFIRLVGCGTNDKESVLEYLTSNMEAAEKQSTKDIFNHGIEVLKTFM